MTLRIDNIFTDPSANVQGFQLFATSFTQNAGLTAIQPRPAQGETLVDLLTGEIQYMPIQAEYDAANEVGAPDPYLVYVGMTASRAAPQCLCEDDFVIIFTIPQTDPCVGKTVSTYTGPGGCPDHTSGANAYDAGTMDVDLSTVVTGYTSPTVTQKSCSMAPPSGQVAAAGSWTLVSSPYVWRYDPADGEGGSTVRACFQIEEDGCIQDIRVSLSIVDFCADYSIDDVTAAD